MRGGGKRLQVVGKIEAPTYKFTVQTEPTVNSLFQKADPLTITTPHFDLHNIQVFLK